jgi:predicted phosphodiesterase
MRIAVLSDIHGNSLALEAVIDDLRGQRVDLVVNLGDIVSGGLDPLGTIALLDKLDPITVRGNHERQLAAGMPGLSDSWARQCLPVDVIERLNALPTSASPVPGVLAFHATPHDDLTYLLDTVDAKEVRAATAEEIAERLGEVASGWDLLLCGHTHIARKAVLPSGTIVVNPGSVGMPAYDDGVPHPHVMESGTPHARYAIVKQLSSRWEVDFRAIEYDWEAAAHQAEAHHRPDIADALRTGTVRR